MGLHQDKGDVFGQDEGEHRKKAQEYWEQVAGDWRTGSPTEVVILV